MLFRPSEPLELAPELAQRLAPRAQFALVRKHGDVALDEVIVADRLGETLAGRELFWGQGHSDHYTRPLTGDQQMPILADPTQLPNPPKPLATDVKIVNPDGTPTRDFHTFLTQVYEWQRTLRRLLTT